MGDWIHAWGDARLLRVVLQNLIDNAWKFTAPTPAARIELGTRLDTDGGPHIVYFVRDNGVGFEMAFAERIFLPFQRLHTDDEFAGSGVGLALVQRILARHGGRVWAESAPGRGATFWFTLPDTPTEPGP
jgi:signal transduction histidine kinase